MPASITLRSGVVILVDEEATDVRNKLVKSADEDLLSLHLNDGGRAGAVVYARVGEVALVIDTPTRPRI